MAKRRKKTDNELLAIIEAEEAASLGSTNQELARQRSKALSFYLGEKVDELTSVEGRSSAISNDVADTINWLRPAIMRIFTAGEDICEFMPVGPEDVKGAEQESQYINHIITQQNDWYNICHTWITDGLLSKNGYVKAYIDEYDDVKKETYMGLSDEEVALLLQDEEVTPIEHTERSEIVIDQMGQQEIRLHDVKVQRTNRKKRYCIVNIPPENIKISQHHTEVSLAKCPFTVHEEWKTISDLKGAGYDIPDDLVSDTENQEEIARNIYYENMADNSSTDEDMRLVRVREVYIRTDHDGDGDVELRQVTVVGKHILQNIEIDSNPIAAWSYNPLPHRHMGQSAADESIQTQILKSTVLRGMLDNIYLANNGRTAVSPKVDLDDMLTSRPGGLVRVDGIPAEHIMPFNHPTILGQTFPMLEYLDSAKENRTGVSRYNQGMDADTLNKTASGINQIMSASQQRTELVARNFANGVRDLCLILHELAQKHGEKVEIVKLRNQWVPVDPRQWHKRTDIQVSVGVGTGNKPQQLQHLTMLHQLQMATMPLGLAMPNHIRETLAKITQTIGFKDVDNYWNNLEKNPLPPPPPPQPSPDAVLKVQADMQKAQMQAQADQVKQQIDSQQIAIAAERDQQKLQMEYSLKEREMLMKHELDREKMLADIQLKQQMAAAKEISINMPKPEPEDETDQALLDAVGQLAAQVAQLQASLSSPKMIVRDEKGRAIGLSDGQNMTRTIVRDQSGKAIGVQ